MRPRCRGLAGEKLCPGESGLQGPAAKYLSGEPLPFDHARAYRLYQQLFGQVEDLLKDKQLLLVPSGPLTQLPFQVLVTAPPAGGGKAVRGSSASCAHGAACGFLAQRHSARVAQAKRGEKRL